VRRLALLLMLVPLAVPGAAQAFRLAEALPAFPKNPVERISTPIDGVFYDPATHCDPTPKPGMVRFQHWLETHVGGQAWGTFRCEKWGPKSASLHAEGRAIDWHLDSRLPASRREGTRLIRMLLAPDRAGNPHALARRMGVEEIIWTAATGAPGCLSSVATASATARTARRASTSIRPPATWTTCTSG
jgi:hypothetical protein